MWLTFKYDSKIDVLSELVPDNWEVHGIDGELHLMWASVDPLFPREEDFLTALNLAQAHMLDIASFRLPMATGTAFGIPIQPMVP